MQVRGSRPYSTPADVLEYQEIARETAESLLISQLPDVSSSSSVHTREAFADEDLDDNDVTNDTAIVNTDDPVWETTAQGTADWYGWYAVDDDGRADDKGVVVWGFEYLNEDETAELPFTALRVKNNTGGLIDILDISSLDVADNGRILYDNPLELGTKDAFFEIYENENASADDVHQIKPLIAVAEEEGSTLEDSSRFIRA